MKTVVGRDVVEARQALQELEAEPGGTLSLTAPIGFGRRQVAPMVTEFLLEHSDIDVELGLSDRRVDLVQEGIDAAIRIGSLPDSTLVARRIAPMRNSGALVPVLKDYRLDDAAEEEAVYVVYPSSRYVSKRLRVFIDYAVSYFEARGYATR